MEAVPIPDSLFAGIPDLAPAGPGEAPYAAKDLRSGVGAGDWSKRLGIADLTAPTLTRLNGALPDPFADIPDDESPRVPGVQGFKRPRVLRAPEPGWMPADLGFPMPPMTADEAAELNDQFGKASGLQAAGEALHPVDASGNPTTVLPKELMQSGVNRMLLGPVEIAARLGNAGLAAFQHGVSGIGRSLQGTSIGDLRFPGSPEEYRPDNAFGGIPEGQPLYKLFNDIAAGPEFLMGSPHMPQVTGIPTFHQMRHAAEGEAPRWLAGGVPADAAKSRIEPTIGEPGIPVRPEVAEEAKPPAEAAPAPEPAVSLDELFAGIPDAAPIADRSRINPGSAAEPPPEPAAARTVDDIAREIDPDNVGRYQALRERQDRYGRWLDELDQQRRATAPESPEVAALREQEATILGRVKGREDALTNAAAQRLAAVRAEIDNRLNPAGDSADMVRVRKAMQQADYAMRDLAEPVSDAYRQAREIAERDARLDADVAAVDAARVQAGAKPVEVSVARPAEEAAPVMAAESMPGELRRVRARGEAAHGLDPANIMEPDPYHADSSFEGLARSLPDDVNGRFQVHGLLAHSGEGVEAGLLNLLDNGIDPGRAFHSGPPRAGEHGVDSTRSNAPYLLISDPGKTLRETGVKNVVLNGPAEANKAALQARYPGVNFMSAAEADQFMRAGESPARRVAPRAEAEPAATTAQVPMMITQAMRQQLADLGYTAEQIRNMKPLEAWDAINDADRAAAAAPEPLPIPPDLFAHIPEVPVAERAPAEPAAPQPATPPLDIAADVTRRLQAAGRPAEEAQAAGRLLSSYYETRAKRFNGALGTAEDLYRAEGPRIQASRNLREDLVRREAHAEPEFAQPDAARELGQAGRVAIDDDGTIWHDGAAVGRVRVDATGPAVRIADIEITPSRRNEGIGSDVIRQIQAEAAAQGKPVVLSTDAMRGRAAQAMQRRLYQRLGFEPNRGPNAVFERIGGRRVAEELVWRPETREYAQPAYHGSPHIFDQFTTDHIGSGEGAQAYGWGLYFAGNKSVAKYYREALAQQPVSSVARLVQKMGGLDEAIAETHRRLDNYMKMPESERRDSLIKIQRDNLAEMDRLRRGEPINKGRLYHVELAPTDAELLDWDKPLNEQSKSVQAALAKAGIKPADAPKPIRDPFIRRIVDEALNATRSDDGRPDPYQVGLIVDNDQRLYNRARQDARRKGVDVEADDFSPGAYVEAQAKEYLDGLARFQEMTGERAYRELQERAKSENPAAADAQREASKALQAQGIRGIKYLDQASRMEGEGSHNYVIFDGADATIREYEQAQRGKIRLGDGRAVITLMKDADASTFIHETGHSWLDDLFRDAKHEAAPADLKADAQTVRDWLGMTSDQAEPTRRQHEKFARGFERYAMEGRAPNPGLAAVFEQFKRWLTDIYQTVTKLRAPINDDIRAVLDRMLAEEPTRRPERSIEAEAPGEHLAGIHETDAEHTPPQFAAEARDRVESERDSVAREHAPAAAEVIDAERARGSAGPGETPTGRAGETPAVAERSAGREEPAPVEPRSGEAGGTGRGARAEPTAADSVAELDPAARFLAEHQTGEIPERSGNIRVDPSELNSTEDIRRALRTMGDLHDEFGEARGLGVTHEMTRDLADRLGLSFGDFMKTKAAKTAQAHDARGYLLASRDLLAQTQEALVQAARKAAGGADADVLEFQRAFARARAVQEVVTELKAEAGRTLESLKIRGETPAARNRAMRDLFQSADRDKVIDLAQRVLALDEDPAKVGTLIRVADKPGLMRKVLEGWKAMLLTGPKTHIKNMLSNTVMAMASVPEAAVAAAIGKVRGGPERVFMSEAGQRLTAMWQGSKEGLLGAGRVLGSKTAIYNQTLVDVAIRTAVKDEGLRGIAADRRIKELMAKPSDEMAAAAKEASEKPDLGGINGPSKMEYPPAIGGTLGKVIRTPFTLLEAEDQIFKGVAFRQEINALAARQASKEGLNGDAFRDRFIDLSLSPSDAMIDAAHKRALYQTFQDPLGKMGRSIQQFANAHWIPGFFLPFTKTPINVMKVAAEWSPLGIAMRGVRDNMLGRNGRIAQDVQIARMGLGTLMAAGTVALAAEGFVTGGGPPDPALKRALRDTGWQPYSLKIGDGYYSYINMDPLPAMTLGIAADMYEAYHAATTDENAKLALMLVNSISKNLAEKTWMQGATMVSQAYSQPEQFSQHLLNSLVGSAIPSIVAQSAQEIDPIMRDARTMLDSLKARTPFLSKTLPPKRNQFGEPITREEGDIPLMFAPLTLSTDRHDKAANEIVRLEVPGGTVPRKVQGAELEPPQFDRLSEMGGHDFRARVDALVSMPGWDSLPNSVQSEAIERARAKARERARKMLIGTEPDLIPKIVDAKIKDALGKP